MFYEFVLKSRSNIGFTEKFSMESSLDAAQDREINDDARPERNRREGLDCHLEPMG